MDTARIIDGEVVNVWRDKTIDEVLGKLPAGEYDLIEVAPDGGPSGGPVICGQLWNGEVLTNPPAPPEPPRVIAKAAIAGRLAEIGKAAAFRTALIADPAFELAWITPGLPVIEAANPFLLATLSAAGLTSEEVDTITA